MIASNPNRLRWKLWRRASAINYQRLVRTCNAKSFLSTHLVRSTEPKYPSLFPDMGDRLWLFIQTLKKRLKIFQFKIVTLSLQCPTSIIFLLLLLSYLFLPPSILFWKYGFQVCAGTAKLWQSASLTIILVHRSQQGGDRGSGSKSVFYLKSNAMNSVHVGQGCNRVLVSLISWPGQLLSLNPCWRPKILARMLFWGFCL